MTSDDPRGRPPRSRRHSSLMETLDKRAGDIRREAQYAQPDPEPYPDPDDFDLASGISPEAEPMPRFIREAQKEAEAAAAKQQRAEKPVKVRLPKTRPAKAPLPQRLRQRFRRASEIAAASRRSWKYRAARFVVYWGAVAAVWFAVILVGAVTIYSMTGGGSAESRPEQAAPPRSPSWPRTSG